MQDVISLRVQWQQNQLKVETEADECELKVQRKYNLITSDFLLKTILQNYFRKLFQKSQNSFQNYFENRK